jgi:hypothetical protein
LDLGYFFIFVQTLEAKNLLKFKLSILQDARNCRSQSVKDFHLYLSDSTLQLARQLSTIYGLKEKMDGILLKLKTFTDSMMSTVKNDSNQFIPMSKSELLMIDAQNLKSRNERERVFKKIFS